MKTVLDRAAIGVPPRAPSASAPQLSLISKAGHTTSPINVDRK
jgi:hypothetical protein